MSSLAYCWHWRGHSTRGEAWREASLGPACCDGQAWKVLVCFPPHFPAHSRGLRWRYALLPGHISVLLPAYRAPGLLGELEVKWDRWALPCSGVGQTRGNGLAGSVWPWIISNHEA